MDATTPIDPAIAPKPATAAGRRKTLFASLATVIALVGVGYGAYDVMIASKHVTTDNAYVGADVAEITPLVGGPVQQVLVEDTQMVRRGQVLVRLDDTDQRIALAKAEALLAQTIRRVQGLHATDIELSALVAARGAEALRDDANVVSAASDQEKATIDLKRREALAKSGSVSGDELTAARNAFAVATANLRAAKAAELAATANHDSAIGSREANRILIQDVHIDDNPDVRAARAALDQAQVDLDRTVIRAPVDGVVTRRQVQVGERVQPGATLMSIVPIYQAYVDANFKEVQLAEVKAGQPVKLTSDLYGDRVVYEGRVAGFSGGTGAAFALVPAQNATGNWIKVVQRLPVRIALDPRQLRAHPLRVGLSMYADIDIGR